MKFVQKNRVRYYIRHIYFKLLISTSISLIFLKIMFENFIEMKNLIKNNAKKNNSNIIIL